MPHSTRPRLLLRRADQLVIAVLVATAVIFQAVYWILQWSADGALIHIDHAPALDAQYAVDLNSAPWPELAQLPNVGETLAKRIVHYRQEHGAFRRHADLENVEGIGPRTLLRIRPYLLPLEGGDEVTGPAEEESTS